MLRAARKKRPPISHSLDKLLKHSVMLYELPPLCDISLIEFEELALERLKLLRIFEQVSNKILRTYSDEWKAEVIAELNHAGLKSYVRLLNGNGKKEPDMAARRRDYLSHFILRFCYCQSEELKRWFVQREMEFFRLKFAGLTHQEIKEFNEVYSLKYTPLTAAEKSVVKDGLYNSTVGHSIPKIEAMDFYKVPCKEVWSLVRHRRCYIHKGFAYVSSNDFVSIVASKHKAIIEKGLAAHNRLLPEIENDDRIFKLINSLHTSYTGKDYTLSANENVPPESLDQLSKKSFPLCMRYMHDILRDKHKLKYRGRVIYGLFLKGIGVTLEDALRFFREEFCKVIDLDKFEKSYSYGIRYNYGKEGARINYTPYSCLKIIQTMPGPDETHGCPYRIFQPSVLRSKLQSYGCGTGHAQEVVQIAEKGHYQLACGRYFEVTHNEKLLEGINHPNHYFELSQIMMGDRQPKQKLGASTSRPSLTQMSRDNKLSSRRKNAADFQGDRELWDFSQVDLEAITQSQTISEKKLKTEEAPAEILKSAPPPAEPVYDDWANEDDDFDMSIIDC